MVVNPGEFNKKIQIVTLVEGKDSDGFPKKSLKECFTSWAKVSQKSANETFKAGAEFATSQKRFLIRYVEGITYQMYVMYNGELYDIIYLNDYDEAHKYIEIIGEKNGTIKT